MRKKRFPDPSAFKQNFNIYNSVAPFIGGIIHYLIKKQAQKEENLTQSPMAYNSKNDSKVGECGVCVYLQHKGYNMVIVEPGHPLGHVESSIISF